MLNKIAKKIIGFLGHVVKRFVKVKVNPEVISKYTATELNPDREKSGLDRSILKTIQRGSLKYTYKGIKCYKNPFDLAIYSKLIFDIRPKTIIEVGSASGGSAIWLADQIRNFGVNGKIYSVDIRPPKGVTDPIVTFLRGDIYHLEESELPSILERAEKPILVIEDGPHFFESCLSALNFFDPYLSCGEYIIIEDGIVNDLGALYEVYKNGPNRAIATFLENHTGKYVIDYNLCDYYGHNFTWNTNGYLRKVRT
jgi:cephalosporin hydroxylase